MDILKVITHKKSPPCRVRRKSFCAIHGEPLDFDGDFSWIFRGISMLFVSLGWVSHGFSQAHDTETWVLNPGEDQWWHGKLQGEIRPSAVSPQKSPKKETLVPLESSKIHQFIPTSNFNSHSWRQIPILNQQIHVG